MRSSKCRERGRLVGGEKPREGCCRGPAEVYGAGGGGACSADLRGASALLHHSVRVLGRLAGRERVLLLGTRGRAG
eukprot:scaffold93777_cov33-Phaeocystis_antarctica.AAC.1